MLVSKLIELQQQLKETSEPCYLLSMPCPHCNGTGKQYTLEKGYLPRIIVDVEYNYNSLDNYRVNGYPVNKAAYLEALGRIHNAS